MANEVLVKVGTQLVFADHATDFGDPTAINDLRPGQAAGTEVQIDLTSVADTEARASTQADFGALRAKRFSVDAAIEIQATATTGELIEFYWGASHNPTAGDGEMGNLGANDADADYTGTPATLAEGVQQLIFLGALVCSADATVQSAHITVFSPPARYGKLVVKNESGAILQADGAEAHIVFTPLIDEVQ